MSAQPPRRSAAAVRDQAHGLRQLFAQRQPRVLPLVHNPLVPDAGAVMERLCVALAALGQRTLVVDAADTATPAQPLALVDLAACIEPLSPQVSYLAAGGLPPNFLDSRATMAGFLEALRSAAQAPACRADWVLLHAGAADLRRMFAGQAPRPLLLAGNRPDSLTHAYTAMKLLSQRLGTLTYDLLVAGDVSDLRAQRMADRLAECADHFLGAALRRVAVVDPLASAGADPGPGLQRLLRDRLADAAREPGAAAPAPTPGPAQPPLPNPTRLRTPQADARALPTAAAATMRPARGAGRLN